MGKIIYYDDLYMSWWTGQDINEIGFEFDFLSNTPPQVINNAYILLGELYAILQLGTVSGGQAAHLVGTNCNVGSQLTFGGNWISNNNPSCLVSEQIHPPAGGQCNNTPYSTPEGTEVYCYDIVTTPTAGCTVTTSYCPTDHRTIDSTCTRFLDQNAETITKTVIPQGCNK